MASAPAAWSSLPRDVLAAVFLLAVDAAAQKNEGHGVGLAEAAALLSAFSPCRWWRAVALDEVRPVGSCVDNAAQCG